MKIFNYERAKPGFNPKALVESDLRHSISQAVAGHALSADEAESLHRAGIDSYIILQEEVWWGRTYWFYFFYRNGNSFSYDVSTKRKMGAMIRDRPG